MDHQDRLLPQQVQVMVGLRLLLQDPLKDHQLIMYQDLLGMITVIPSRKTVIVMGEA